MNKNPFKNPKVLSTQLDPTQYPECPECTAVVSVGEYFWYFVIFQLTQAIFRREIIVTQLTQAIFRRDIIVTDTLIVAVL